MPGGSGRIPNCRKHNGTCSLCPCDVCRDLFCQIFSTRNKHITRHGRYNCARPLPSPDDDDQPNDDELDDALHDLALDNGLHDAEALAYESMSDHSDENDPGEDYDQVQPEAIDVMQSLAMDLLGLVSSGDITKTGCARVLKCVQARLGFKLGSYRLPKSFHTLEKLAQLPKVDSSCTWPVCDCGAFAFAPEVTECIECHKLRPLQPVSHIVVFDYVERFMYAPLTRERCYRNNRNFFYQEANGRPDVRCPFPLCRGQQQWFNYYLANLKSDFN
jgi:hypothetical protein